MSLDDDIRRAKGAQQSKDAQRQREKDQAYRELMESLERIKPELVELHETLRRHRVKPSRRGGFTTRSAIYRLEDGFHLHSGGKLVVWSGMSSGRYPTPEASMRLESDIGNMKVIDGTPCVRVCQFDTDETMSTLWPPILNLMRHWVVRACSKA